MNKYKEIEHILLDLDDTLYSYDIPHESALDCMLNLFETLVSIEKVKIREIYNTSRKIINERLVGQAASHSRLLYAKEMCESVGIRPILFAQELERAYWDHFLTKMVLNVGVMEFLDSCKKQKIGICIITDLTTEIQIRKIKKLGIEKYIDYLVTSEEAGVEKPNRKIFDLAIFKLSANPKRTIMIGDNYNKDIIGAQEVGIRALHFSNKNFGAESVSSFFELREKIN